MLINTLVSALLQLILFSILPFLWWFVGYRGETPFLEWLGLKKPNMNKKTIWGTILLTLGFLTLGFFVLDQLKGVETANSKFAGLGAKAILPVLVFAIFQTALSEEILFRGFLLKRIAKRGGFVLGNLIQSFLFALLHGVLFFSRVGWEKATLIFLFTGLVAYVMGYLNEKWAKGSIHPSWTVHSISNLVSGLCVAFSLI